MAKYYVTVMNENGKIVKQKDTSSIKDARAFGVRNLKTQTGTVYIKEGEIYSVRNSFMDAPGGRIERMGNTYYFIQDGVCWTVYKDGSLGRKEIL
jgi:hypothetical protein